MCAACAAAAAGDRLPMRTTDNCANGSRTFQPEYNSRTRARSGKLCGSNTADAHGRMVRAICVPGFECARVRFVPELRAGVHAPLCTPAEPIIRVCLRFNPLRDGKRHPSPLPCSELVGTGSGCNVFVARIYRWSGKGVYCILIVEARREHCSRRSSSSYESSGQATHDVAVRALARLA